MILYASCNIRGVLLENNSSSADKLNSIVFCVIYNDWVKTVKLTTKYKTALDELGALVYFT